MILLQGEGHIFIQAASPLTKARDVDEVRRLHSAAADTYLGASFYRGGKKVGTVVGFVAEWPYPVTKVMKADGLAPDEAYMDIHLTAYGDQLVKAGRWDDCFGSMEVRPLGGVKKAEKLKKALARIYTGTENYHAPLVSPNDGAQLTHYNEPWDQEVRGYGPTGVPDVHLMDPLASVVDMGTLFQLHGPKQFHEAARMLPVHHLMQAAEHAGKLGHSIQGPLLAAAADNHNANLGLLHTGALDPSGPANRPVTSADAGEMVEGIDLTQPQFMNPLYQRYGGKPVKKEAAAVSLEMNEWLDSILLEEEVPVEKAKLKRKQVLLLDTGVDHKAPRDLNAIHVNMGEHGVKHLAAKLLPSEAASLAVNPHVLPAVRRILARRGRNV